MSTPLVASVALPRPRSVHAAAAVVLVAATYVYFLLFAHFGFLEGLHAGGVSTRSIQGVLAAMAAAGVISSLAAPRLVFALGRGGAMGLGLFICAGAAAAAGYAMSSGLRNVGHLIIAATGIGAGLGLVTVGLAADLRRLARGRYVGVCAGLGTGIAYLVCNIPALYDAAPTTKAWCVAIVALLAIIPIAVTRGHAGGDLPGSLNAVPPGWRGSVGLAGAIAAFLALVAFDAATFRVLQLTPDLHAQHWGPGANRWLYGGLHLVAGVLAGLVLDRGGLRSIVALALLLITAGALNFDAADVWGAMAAPFYVMGVSAYSTALVAFAALAPDATAGRDTAAFRAAWLYAIGGWIGSALGVSLAEQLGRVPGWLPLGAAGLLTLAVVQAMLPRAPK